MSDLSESLKKLKFDNRMLNWNIRQKVVTQEEYDAYISKLKDVSHLKNETPYEDSEGSQKPQEESS